MGTHPIFESDFDCLTDRTGPNLPIMTEQMTFKGSLKGHDGWVTQIATTPIFPDMLLSSSRDKTIIMWHLTREEGSYGVPKRRMQGQLRRTVRSFWLLGRHPPTLGPRQ